jgi:tetratricopeptide (TPR) repeat protein
VASGLNVLAEALRQSGQFDEAEVLYREALTMAAVIGHSGGVAYYTGNLALLALARKQWAEAERLARKALKLSEVIGRKEAVAFICACLAKALAQEGRGVEGIDYAKRAVTILTELRSPELAWAQTVLNECLG